MQRPVDAQVHDICYKEDQAAFLSRSANEPNTRLASGIEVAIHDAFTPIGQSINSFIVAETQGQIEGLGRIVNQFVGQMNNALGGQFVQLAQTLSGINQAQGVSYEAINSTMAAANTILDNIQHTHAVSQSVIERFEGFVRELTQAQSGQTEYTEQMSALLGSMYGALKQQTDSFVRLQTGRADMEQQMQQYASGAGACWKRWKNKAMLPPGARMTSPTRWRRAPRS